MKIWFRIGAKQDGPQPPERYSSTDSEVGFLRLGRSSGKRFFRPGRPGEPQVLRPLDLLAITTEESICEAGRISGVRFLRVRRAGGTRLSASLPHTQKLAPATTKLPI